MKTVVARRASHGPLDTQASRRRQPFEAAQVTQAHAVSIQPIQLAFEIGIDQAE
jgi:hypothetical protein